MINNESIIGFVSDEYDEFNTESITEKYKIKLGPMADWYEFNTGVMNNQYVFNVNSRNDHC